ncbi:MAG: pyridoxamine 5'-phosphate oxidase [Geminicoccaceae bacterium]
MDPKLAAMREDYVKGGLDEANVAADPILQFRRWFDAAVEGGVYEPNGMTLATVGEDGQPSARVVLLKGLDERGLAFYTNKASRKGQQIAANAKAALTFWWGPVERQVRFEGVLGDVEADEADAYYASRPLGSRIGAWASPQSQTVASRDVLEQAERELTERYADGNPPRPPHWGGYRLTPSRVEFWQGRSSRLHDRLCYRLVGDQWVIERLAP